MYIYLLIQKTYNIATGVLVDFYTRVSNSDSLSMIHFYLTTILIIILIVDNLLDYLTTIKNKVYTTELAISFITRSISILGLVLVCYFFDRLLLTGAIVYTFGTLAFIYHNTKSIIAHIYILGWQKYFPIWLFKILEHEISNKMTKYITNPK